MSSKFFLSLGQQWFYATKISFLFLVLLSAGCASKDASNLTSVDNETTYKEVDLNVKLTAEQERILKKTGELDKNLPSKAMPAVARQYSHFLNKGRITMAKFSQRSEDYLGHARQVFRERGMPEELAFIAIVESGYNTTIKSHAGAAGAWQFMPYTGMSYGLHRDWWIDERLDPYESVEAAATYLKKLHNYFGDWLLAIAAYNAGEGKIGRALKGTGAKDFFTLVELNYKLDYKAQLRKETIDYVPRFLAVCKIMRNLDALGFENVDMNKAPQHARIETKPGTDLKAMAKVVKVPWNDFQDANSAHKQYVTHASKSTYVYVPSHSKSIANAYATKGKSPYAWQTVTVPKGETWTSISKKSGVPVAALKASNSSSSLRKGKIRIPQGPGVKIPKFDTYLAGGKYKIKPGDTLSAIAVKHKVSTKSLMAANKISDASKIRSGQILKIPGKSATIATKSNTSNKKQVATKQSSKKSNTKNSGGKKSKKTAVAKAKTHKIASGETLLGIAIKYDVSTKNLMQANNIGDASKVRAGQVLKIPSDNTAVAEKKVKPKTYTVKSGDTYWGIARKYDLSTSELLALNKKTKSSTLRAGEKLLVSSK